MKGFLLGGSVGGGSCSGSGKYRKLQRRAVRPEKKTVSYSQKAVITGGDSFFFSFLFFPARQRVRRTQLRQRCFKVPPKTCSIEKKKEKRQLEWHGEETLYPELANTGSLLQDGDVPSLTDGYSELEKTHTT